MSQHVRSLREELTAAQALFKAQKHEAELANYAKLEVEASYSQTTSDLQRKADQANALAEELQNEMALLKTELAAEQQRSCSLALDFEATKVWQLSPLIQLAFCKLLQSAAAAVMPTVAK